MASKTFRYLLYMLRIRRFEFRIAEIPVLAIPVLLLAPDTAILRTFAFWEGVFIFFLLFAFGDMINCLADRDLDAVYKPHLSESVYGLGVKNVKFQIWATAILAFVLSVHLSWQMGRWPIALFTLSGLVLGTAYSVKPVQLKGRGLLQLLCLWTIIFVGPMLFVTQLVRAEIAPGVLIFAAVYGVLQMGIILVNTAEDYPEDLAEGIGTTIVSLGLKRGISLSTWLTIAGAVGVLIVLGELYVSQNLGVMLLAGLMPVAAACFFAVASVGRLHYRVSASDLAEAIRIVKTTAKLVPLWLTLVAWSTLWATGVLFYYK